jgi:hypothetical protein
VKAGEKTLQLLAFEVLKPAPIGSDKPLYGPTYSLSEKLSTSCARVYDFSLGAGLSAESIEWDFYGIIVSTTSTELSIDGDDNNPYADGKLQSYCEFKWFQSTGKFNITNKGTKPYKALLIEWLNPLCATNQQ